MSSRPLETGWYKLNLTYRRMLLLIAATLGLTVVVVATSVASGAGAAGPAYCVVQGRIIAPEEGAESPRDPLTVQQHAPQNGNPEAPGQEPTDGHC
jgi:hypothetical protein